MLSSRECIAWLAVHIIEYVAIVTVNIVTIIAFMKNCNLRKRSTYLLLNLAVVDMLVGFMGSFTVYEFGILFELWNNSLGWKEDCVLRVLRLFFAISSVLNITIISVERLHATVCPLRHRFVKKRIYLIVIVVSYLIAALVSIVSYGIPLIYSFERPFNVATSFISVCIVVIFFSYSLILIKVKCRRQPRHHVVPGKEGRLTVTLFMVTFVSLIMWLPFVVQCFLWHTSKIVRSYSLHLICVVIILLGANSLVNPLLYAIRIPEFKITVKAMFRKAIIQQRQVVVLRLHAMQR